MAYNALWLVDPAFSPNGRANDNATKLSIAKIPKMRALRWFRNQL